MGFGDEIMVTGQARLLQQADPRKVKVIYERDKWFDAWLYNPRIAQRDEVGDFQEYRPRIGYLRPYIAHKAREQWTWKAHQPPAGELYFGPEEMEFGRRFAGRIILHPHIKAHASPNKDWNWIRWSKLAWLLQEKWGLRLTQLGSGTETVLQGAEQVTTRNLRYAAAVIAGARAVVCPEGAFHHICAATGTPAVVIYGGYISPEVTGYPGQVNFFTGDGLGCGMRAPCNHCKTAMDKIKPEEVAERLVEALNVSASKRLAA